MDHSADMVNIIDISDNESDQEPNRFSAMQELQTDNMSKTNINLDRSNAAELEALRTPVSITSEDLIDLQPHQCNRGEVGSLPSILPRDLEAQLDEWYDQNLGKIPPFATSKGTNTSLYETVSGLRASWKHRGGAALRVNWYDLPDHLYPKSSMQNKSWRLLVAEGRTMRPCFIRATNNRNVSWYVGRGTAYKVWLGMEGLSKDGFEFDPSVFKSIEGQEAITAGTSPAAEANEQFAMLKQSMLLRKDVKLPQRYGNLVSWKSLKRKNTMSHANGENNSQDIQSTMASKASPPAAIVSRASILPQWPEQPLSARRIRQPRRRPRQTATSLLTRTSTLQATDSGQSFRQSNAIENLAARSLMEMSSCETTMQRLIAEKAAAGFDPSSLDVHILNNTVLLFYKDISHAPPPPSPPPPPRPRMISACETVSKLFAQATASAVFPESTMLGELKVLSLKVNNSASIITVVQNDEEDFEGFLFALRHAACWKKDLAGHFQGSCIVEVRGLM